jgi:L-asparaginase II
MYEAKCQCGRTASVYAMDRCAGGWAGYFCLSCVPRGWDITDYVKP